MKKFIIFLLVIVLLPTLALARVGVGIGNSKIILNEPLRLGGVYQLPPVTVLNTGNEGSNYEVAIAYHSEQTELWPEREWFSFSPAEIYLEPGKGQAVETILSLPVKAEPGNYFAYIEARPLQKDVTDGSTTIGIAAASKFYFSIAPSNIFQGTYYKIMSLMSYYAPWTYIVLAVIVVAILLTIFKKHFRFQISVGKKK